MCWLEKVTPNKKREERIVALDDHDISVQYVLGTSNSHTMDTTSSWENWIHV